MDVLEQMRNRHSVRQYTGITLAPDAERALRTATEAENRKSHLHFKLVLGEPAVFRGVLPFLGKFRGAESYLIFAGSETPALEEQVGYYGERLLLRAMELGLDSCWVGATYQKNLVKKRLSPGDRLVCILALGYGVHHGEPHRSKPLSELCPGVESAPTWFQRGAEGASLAPTALNQQKFRLTLEGEKVHAENLGGAYSKVDLGIVKCHFELASGKDSSIWI